MRKAVIEIEKYTVKEGANGGWSAGITGAPQPVSIHETKAEAVAAAKRYAAADQRRAS